MQCISSGGRPCHLSIIKGNESLERAVPLCLPFPSSDHPLESATAVLHWRMLVSGVQKGEWSAFWLNVCAMPGNRRSVYLWTSTTAFSATRVNFSGGINCFAVKRLLINLAVVVRTLDKLWIHGAHSNYAIWISSTRETAYFFPWVYLTVPWSFAH